MYEYMIFCSTSCKSADAQLLKNVYTEGRKMSTQLMMYVRVYVPHATCFSVCCAVTVCVFHQVCVCLKSCSSRTAAGPCPFVGGACCYSDGSIVTVREPAAPSVLSGRSACEAAGCDHKPNHLQHCGEYLLRIVLLGNSSDPSLFPASCWQTLQQDRKLNLFNVVVSGSVS